MKEDFILELIKTLLVFEETGRYVYFLQIAASMKRIDISINPIDKLGNNDCLYKAYIYYSSSEDFSKKSNKILIDLEKLYLSIRKR